jgi:hypothetical protein
MPQRGNTRANVPYNRRKKLTTGFIARHYTCPGLHVSESLKSLEIFLNALGLTETSNTSVFGLAPTAINHSTSPVVFHSPSHSYEAILFRARIIACSFSGES